MHTMDILAQCFWALLLNIVSKPRCPHNGYSGSILYDFLIETKVPSAMDIPADIRLELYNSGKNKGLVLGSKAVGETSLLGGVSVLMALRYSGQSPFFWLQRIMIGYLKTRHWSCQEGRRTRPLGSLRQAFSKFRHRNLCLSLFTTTLILTFSKPDGPATPFRVREACAVAPERMQPWPV